MLTPERPAAKVYLVMGHDWEDSYVESIWTTEEAAEKRAAELRTDEERRPYEFEVAEHEVQSDA